MKSSKQQLEQRGYIDESDLITNINDTPDDLIVLLQSDKAKERSCAAIILSKSKAIYEKKYVAAILDCLNKENCLYTKIEICQCLEKGNIDTAKEMVLYLGVIGNNQHKSLPRDVSKKKSYPLPRDIIARSLGRMNSSILPVLFDVLEKQDLVKCYEVLDAIGYLVFYDQELAVEENFCPIAHLADLFKMDMLLLWKTVQCLSAFPISESIDFLRKVESFNKNPLIQKEIKRSLKFISLKCDVTPIRDIN